nr:hypothetical protein Iba_chr04aCG10940 [Ipomoea batatas]
MHASELQLDDLQAQICSASASHIQDLILQLRIEKGELGAAGEGPQEVQVDHSTMEKDWDLQAVPIPSLPSSAEVELWRLERTSCALWNTGAADCDKELRKQRSGDDELRY